MEMAIRNIVIDCNDMEAMTRFWGAFIGYETRWSNATYNFMLRQDGGRPGLVLQAVPEVATEKNRIHFDIEVADVEAAAQLAQDLGATLVTKIEEDGLAWTVMRDPEGNYFCIQQAER
jgi:predicted enzyme related to lactoylglutathione lyase